MRVPKNWPEDVPKPSPTPARYYEDQRWTADHWMELVERYPDRWIAVFDGEVIAAGKDGEQVMREAREKTGERDIVLRLVETTRKFYSRQGVL